MNQKQNRPHEADGNGAVGRLQVTESILPHRAAGCTVFDTLLTQAAHRITTDPARCGEHFQVWLSLNAAKTGWPWPDREDYRCAH